MLKRMPELISLPTSAIHLWLAYYNEISDERLHDAYRKVLNDEERRQQARFRFVRDQCRYLVTRAMVRTVLSRYAMVRPEDWIFSANAYGRPEINNVEARRLGLSFNISHTHSLIVLGIAHHCALGVDVENVTTREASIDIAEQFFAQSEVSALAALPRETQQFRFFEYWTFKESYIKARGLGLSLPLDKFGFDFPGERAVEIDIHPELADMPTRWRFWQFQPTPKYLVAVCADRLDGHCTDLVVRQVVPMKSEQTLVMHPLRTSQ